MEAAPDKLVPDNREGLAWLAQLLLELAQERSLDGVLRKAIDAAAALPDVALARVYLLAPGDICPTCPQRPACPDQTQCLHAAVNGGRLLHVAPKNGCDWRMITDGSPWGSTRPAARSPGTRPS
jgi:hypothetical protein